MKGRLPNRGHEERIYGPDECRGCGAVLGALHRPGCPYGHPWPRDRVDHVQTRITPLTDTPPSSREGQSDDPR
jgi:hypothetical protein